MSARCLNSAGREKGVTVTNTKLNRTKDEEEREDGTATFLLYTTSYPLF